MLRSQISRTILLATLTGLFGAVFSLSPQINLWMAKGGISDSVYASHDMDEACYAAYVQSLIDGKPRRNSPYTGTEDGPDTPLKESLFSIQFAAFYPTALVARAFGLSSSTAFILASGVFGFFTGIAVFWLFFILFENPFLSFAGGLVVLAAGALAAGQGSFVRSYFPDSIYYGIAFPFARRIVPLAGFPFLFLFFGGTWKILTTDESRKRVWYMVATSLVFGVLVYSYFYLWTTAFAWLAGVSILLLVLRPDQYRLLLKRLSLLAAAMLVLLIPYLLLLANRSETIDSVQLLEYTRRPDLTRIPELISFAVAAVFGLLAAMRKIDLRDVRMLFLFSFSLAAPIVFNQQIVTGRSLQPVHYQFFAANYTALFALLSLLFLLLTATGKEHFNKLVLVVALVGFYIGYIEVTRQASLDILRDDFVPIANYIKETSTTDDDLVMAFDLAGTGLPASDEMPSLASRPVLWALHQRVFADISTEDNLERFFYFLYLQKKDDVWLREELTKKNPLVMHGVFGWGRNENEVLTEKNPISLEEIEQSVDLYRQFILGFDPTKAAKYPITFVIAHEQAKESFGNFDKYYDREVAGKFRRYILYRTRLRH